VFWTIPRNRDRDPEGGTQDASDAHRINDMMMLAPFAPAPGRVAVRAGHLPNVESGLATLDHTLPASDGRIPSGWRSSVTADCMGWANRVGTLAAGRFADPVAGDGDPRAGITVLGRPAVVLRGGRVALDLRAG
jgi:hypothetical protein